MSADLDLTGRHVVPPSWLSERLGAPGLRVVDATVILDIDTWEANSGRLRFEEARVPGAVFADLMDELSDPSGDEGLPRGVRAYRLPSAESFAAAVGRLGIGDDTAVVTYDTVGGMWAARLWWLLRVFGHDQVAVLDGGFARWADEGRPVESGPAEAPAPATFTAELRPELLATKEQVLGYATEGGAHLVHALSPEMFRGEEQGALPRPGRIPRSVNVPFPTVYAGDGTFRPVPELRELFASAGVDGDGRVVTYCGGGIAASSAALALALVGVDAAVYDGSLVEWVADESLPVETG